jgi:hypothetical protein
MTVGVLGFDKQAASLDKVTQFTAAMNAAGLAETGESFLLRGTFDEGRELAQAKALQVAVLVHEQKEQFPLADPEAPVALEVRYGGQAVPLKIEDGRALLREPAEGQKVSFVLRRKGASKERYGVVLKVNGENTLYRERLKDVDCHKWILDPGDGPVTINGFQLTNEKAEAFKVLSKEASKKKEMDYGADVGTLSLVVFREKGSKDRPKPLLTDEEEDLAALTRGVFPKEKPLNLAALREQLWTDATRGLIVQGDKIEAGVQQVPFTPDPVPVMTATIVYYRP